MRDHYNPQPQMIILAFALPTADLCRVSGERFIMSRGLRIRRLSPLSPGQAEMVVGTTTSARMVTVALAAQGLILRPRHSLRDGAPLCHVMHCARLRVTAGVAWDFKADDPLLFPARLPCLRAAEGVLRRRGPRRQGEGADCGPGRSAVL